MAVVKQEIGREPEDRGHCRKRNIFYHTVRKKNFFLFLLLKSYYSTGKEKGRGRVQEECGLENKDLGGKVTSRAEEREQRRKLDRCVVCSLLFIYDPNALR